MELKTRAVRNLEDPAYIFVSDSQDARAVKEHVGALAEDYDSFFVKVGDGEYTEVWGMCGIVPRLSNLVTRIVSEQD